MVSKKRIQRMRVQGYCGFSSKELSEFHFGNRFAFGMCSVILLPAIAYTSLPVLEMMAVIAFLGIILPHHPFDYIYNLWLSKLLGKPALPPRSRQLKFTCIIATAFLLGIILSFYTGLVFLGYALGIVLISVAILVTTTDICIPSMIYNMLFKYEVDRTAADQVMEN